MLRTYRAYRDGQRRLHDGAPAHAAPAWLPRYEAALRAKTSHPAPGAPREVAALAAEYGVTPLPSDADVVVVDANGDLRYDYAPGTTGALFRALASTWSTHDDWSDGASGSDTTPTRALDFVVRVTALPSEDELVRALLVWSTYPHRLDPIRVHVDRVPRLVAVVRPLVPPKVRARLQVVSRSTGG